MCSSVCCTAGGSEHQQKMAVQNIMVKDVVVQKQWYK
jgi:hypothetical protein